MYIYIDIYIYIIYIIYIYIKGDSCVNELLSITHEIHQPFDDNLEVRAVCLDIYKAFDKV